MFGIGEKKKPKIELGDRVRDTYTKFEGIAVSRVDFLYGCARIGIESTEMKDGKPIGSEYFDEQRVELVESKEKVVTPESRATTGGPYTDPPRAANPTRSA